MFKIIKLLVATTIAAAAYDPTAQRAINNYSQQTAHISPEIIKEFKDFEDLIPAATIDEIVAKHYVIDKNFRTAFRYLRSQEFTQLQKELLDTPEIIQVLEFLHLTTENATWRHMDVTKAETAKVSDSYKDVGAGNDDTETYDDNKVVTSAGTTTINTMSFANVKETLDSIKADRKQQQFQMAEKFNGDIINNNSNEKTKLFADDEKNALGDAAIEGKTLLRIVLLENSVIKEAHPNHNQHYLRKYHRQNNNYHNFGSLGTFTEFVDEILQHLPHTAFQNMITDKCKKNVIFAKFYQALRSPQFKPLVAETMATDNIKKIVQTLGANNINVKQLEPIAFQVISWGPNI